MVLQGGKDDVKLYLPLKKTQIQEFPELKEVVDIDSDSDWKNQGSIIRIIY